MNYMYGLLIYSCLIKVYFVIFYFHYNLIINHEIQHND